MPPGAGGPPGGPMGANLAMFGQAGQAGQPGMPQNSPQALHLKAAEQAKMGRFGDSIVAHLTPGELTIPVQLQSPAVLKAVREEFARIKVDPSKFVAGSPTGSRNPATGNQEFALLGGLLPTILGVVGGVAGSAIAPGIGTVAGGALGSAAGEAASGGTLNQDLTVGLASGVGSAMAPGIGAKIGDAVGGAAAGSAGASAAGSAAGSTLPVIPNAVAGNSLSSAMAAGGGSAAGGMAGAPMGQVAGAASGASPGLLGAITSRQGMQVIGSGVGAAMGQNSAGPIATKAPNNSGFNKPFVQPGANFNQIMGNQNASVPSFGGFNAAQQAQQTGGYNFYSPNGNGT